jgi:peptide/nickel transport system ATP-binding protein
MTESPLLSVRNLRVSFETAHVRREVVSGVDFDLAPGSCLAIVGESGSGKSVTARSLVGLAGVGSQVSADRLAFEGQNLLGLKDKAWRTLRGSRIGFVLQDALVSLDPLRPVGDEIVEALALHGVGTTASRRARALELLAEVGVPDPATVERQRPHELSGGLRQRALIASAIALHPNIVIADEPTTALDVTVQAQVLDVLEQMKARGTAILLISHDLSVVARLADEILVMTGGEVVEQGPAALVLGAPQHPYTQALLDAIPGEHTKGIALTGRDLGETTTPVERLSLPVIEARDLTKSFIGPDRVRRTVVVNAGFELLEGETVGIVGESGSGKSTSARLVLGLETPDSGEVYFDGLPWSAISRKARRQVRREVAVVYQDPLSSFDPRWTVERIIADNVGPAHATPVARAARVRELLDQVGLAETVLRRKPLTLSGGQRQRVAIARALAADPRVIVLDEAVSALDVSVQAQVLDLLSALQNRLGLSYLFISHDLGVIRHMSDRIVVMKEGRIVEQGDAEQLFTDPQHPYTQELLASMPRLPQPV